MDIQYAILGLLNQQPCSGYDLKKLIAESEVFYWSGNNNQIYNSLIALHQAGLVTQEVHYQESLPAKKIYAITPTGQARLLEWLHSEPELPELHNPFLIRLACADALPDAGLEALLERYAAEIEVQLQMRIVETGRSPALPAATVRAKYLRRKIIEKSVAVYQSELDWVRQVRDGLNKI
jgi:PadR family transcriptional regulator, regulatory protein AphA